MKTSIIVTLLTVGGVLIAVPILFDVLMMSHIEELRKLSGPTITGRLFNYFLVWGFFTHLVCWIIGVILLSVGISSAKP